LRAHARRDGGENARIQQADIEAWLDEGLNAAEAFVGNSKGNARAAITASARKLAAVYSCPFQNRAPMGPMNATVIWTPTRCDARAPTQNGEAALVATAISAGLPQTQCVVHRMDEMPKVETIIMPSGGFWGGVAEGWRRHLPARGTAARHVNAMTRMRMITQPSERAIEAGGPGAAPGM